MRTYTNIFFPPMDFYSIDAKLIFSNVPTTQNVQKSPHQLRRKSEAFLFVSSPQQIPFEGPLCARHVLRVEATTALGGSSPKCCFSFSLTAPPTAGGSSGFWALTAIFIYIVAIPFTRGQPFRPWPYSKTYKNVPHSDKFSSNLHGALTFLL